ncbi:hypothetical protein J7E97_24085, partial [Streptomyces sp. ISL-66]|nr:hypothetical protein [Streptomyces sp. ISL-66]
MTMDSAPARHTGQGGTGPAGGSTSAGMTSTTTGSTGINTTISTTISTGIKVGLNAGTTATAAGPTAVRRSVTAIHPPRGPKTDQARTAVRPRRVRHRDGVLPLLAADALAVVATAAALPGLELPRQAAAPLAVLLVALHAQAGL